MSKMKIYFDKYHQPVQPKLYLGTPNNKVICAINGIDESSFQLIPNVNNTYELSFDVNRYILVEDLSGKTIEMESNVYSLIGLLMRIYVENVGWFIMSPPTISNDGIKEKKTINAQSCEIEFQQHDLNNFKINLGTADSYEMLADENVETVDNVEFAKEQIKFYNSNNPQLSLIDLAIKASGLKGWSVGYVDTVPKAYKYYEDGELKQKTTLLSDEIGTFDVESQDLYSFLTQDVAKFFQCVFVFDSRRFKINVYRPENFGKDTNINIGFRNLQQSNEIKIDEDNMFTRYFVQGSDGLDIRYVNFGLNYIEDLSYYTNEKYMSKKLIVKYKYWLEDVELKRPLYIENTRLYNNQNNVISELYDRVPLDDCSTDWSTFEDDKLIEVQANYQAQLKGYEQFYVDKDGNFDKVALDASSDANDYYQIKDVILPSIKIEIDNRELPTDDDKSDYIDSYKTNWKLYGLDELQVKLDEYQNTIEICEKNGYDKPYTEDSSHTKDTHEKMYGKYIDAKNQLNPDYVGGCKKSYDERKQEIDDATAIQNQYDKTRKEIAKSINKETWEHHITTGDVSTEQKISFTSDDLVELSKLYIDGNYTNENMFLVNSDDSVSAIDEQLKLLSAAQDDLYIASHPQYTYTTNLDNFLAKYEYKNYTDNLNLGDYIYLGISDDYVVKLRVVSMQCNLLAMDNNLQITFSNMIQSRAKRDDAAYLFGLSSGGSKKSASGNSNDFLNNEGITLTAGLIQKLLATGAFSNKVSQIVNNEFAGIIAGSGGSVSVPDLNAKMIKVIDITGENAFFDYLQSKLISAGKIVADSAEFKELDTLVSTIKQAIIGTSSTETGIVINLTAENATISEGFIKSLISQYITVNDLKAGNIITDKINILSRDGKLKIIGNTFTIYDDKNNPVIQLGQDKNGKYGLVISDENGAVLLDSEGLHEGIVPNDFIKTDMIADGQVTESKLDKTNIREWTDKDGNKVFDVTKMYYGDDMFINSYQSTLTEINHIKDDVSNLEPSFNIVMSNETQNIPCTNTGLTSIPMLIEIPYVGYVGLTQTECNVSIGTLPSGITLGEKTDASSTTIGKIVLNVAENSNLGANDLLSGSIDITFSIKGKNIVKKFTWTKTKAGDKGEPGLNGKNARLFILNPSSIVIKKNTDNTLSPSTIIFKSYYKDGDSTIMNNYSGRFIISESMDNMTFSTKYTSNQDEQSKVYTPSSSDVKIIKCILCASGGITKQLDSQTVTILTDADGVNDVIDSIRESVSNVELKVDNNTKAISQKATQKDIENFIDNYDNSTVKIIRNQVSQHTTKIGGIESSVSDVQTELIKKADGTTVQALTERIANAEQDASGFKQTVEDTYSTKNELSQQSTTLKSEFNQRANEIKQEITDARGSSTTLKTRLDGIDSSVIDAESNAKSFATQEANRIKSIVTQDVDSKISMAQSEFNQRADEIEMSVSSKQDIGKTAIRYIRDWLDGSNKNSDNIWVECKVISQNSKDSSSINLAEGKIPVCKNSSLENVSITDIGAYTDSRLLEDEEDKYVKGTGQKQCLQIDLGSVHYDIDYIQIWHYYKDERIFKHLLQVSEDGSSWVTIYDSNVSGGYKETSDGFIHIINSSYITTNMAKLNVTANSLKGQLSNIDGRVTEAVADIDGIRNIVTNDRTYAEGIEELLNKLKGDFNEKVESDAVFVSKTNQALDSLSDTYVKKTDYKTDIANLLQSATGWEWLFAQLGMYDVPSVQTNVKIDINGITVTNPKTGQITKMRIDGFSGWNNDDKIFWIEGDTTKTRRLLCEKGWDTDVIKMTTNTFSISENGNVTKLNGVSFVKSGGTS